MVYGRLQHRSSVYLFLILLNVCIFCSGQAPFHPLPFLDGTITWMSLILLSQCNCPPEWTGDRCETAVKVSCKGLCHNGGTCNETTNICLCPSGFSGTLCENCEGLVCENGGYCAKDKKGKMTCSCPGDFGGVHCEKSCHNYCQNKVSLFLFLTWKGVAPCVIQLLCKEPATLPSGHE